MWPRSCVKLGELPAATQEPEATLEPTATPEELEGYDAIIKAQEEDAFVNVYAEPAVESEVLAQLMSASAIKVLSVEGDFARISIGDLIGYVEAGFLGHNDTALSAAPILLWTFRRISGWATQSPCGVFLADMKRQVILCNGSLLQPIGTEILPDTGRISLKRMRMNIP